LFCPCESQSAKNKSIRGLHLFEMAHLLVSSFQNSNLPVLLSSPAANFLSVAICRGSMRAAVCSIKNICRNAWNFSDAVPHTGDPRKLQHCCNVQKSTDICVGCSYAVPAVREGGRPRIQKRAI